MAPPVVGVDDMCMLTNLTQETLLENTERRFKANTFTGSILVSVNPYQPLPIYKVDDVNRYIGQQLGANPPHLFAIAEDSYANLRLHNRDQSILISGESGSGKTEATKLIMQYLAAMTRKKETQQDSVEMMILESSPILEAFGNAKTVRNNNSSRFGKFLEVCFDANGQIAGAKIVQYLLEKSRLVRQATDERNYHVFYALVYGSSDEEKAKYKLQPAEFYHYLNQSGCTSIKGINEKEELARLKTAFHYLGIDKTKQTKIFGILSAILLLGNVEFTDVSLVNNVEAHVKNTSLLNIIANLLDLRPDLLATALVKRKMTIKGQADTLIPLKSAEAAENRDAMSKALYGRLFTWLVNTINNKIQSKSTSTLRSIGILDIFGFENFPLNSFEQFCINYANEKLQGHFNQHIFSIEQQEYDKEGINWAKIEFKDNQDVLDLIEKRPVGLFSLMDEECRFPRATDMTLLQKLNSNHERNANYAKSRIGDSKQFGVNHYSGPVAYDVTGFLDKNKDTLQLLLLELCQSSKHEILAEMFAEEKEEGANKMTVGAQFKDQLANLMKNLSLTMPHYVRCVKPNSEKAPEKFDAELVLAQLRYSGMLETIRIRKLGYPVRFLFHDFIRRFKCLAPKITGFNERETSMKVVQLCEKSFGLSDTYQMGKTKVFLRDLFYNKLETARTAAMALMATVCKKTWKMHRVRKEYLRNKKSALLTQTLVRRLLDRKSYEKVEKAASYVQSFVRAYPDRKDFFILRGAAVTIQGVVHSDTTRANYLNLQNATLMFQTLIRRRLAQSYKDYLIARRDRKSHLPPITASSSFSSLISPLSTPSPRNVSFRDPLRSVSHSADSDDSEAIGDRAGTPPAPETQRERRERRAEREREKEREKEEKKERERAERLALTDRLSLPVGMSAVPLPPKKPESPFTPLRAPSPPRAFTKVYSAPSLGTVGSTSSLQSTRSTIFSQRKNTAAGPVPPPVFVHFPNLLPSQTSEDATPPSTPDLEEPSGKGKDDKAGVIDSAKFPLSKYAAKLQPSIKGAPSTATTILTYSSKASTQPLHKIPYGPLFKTALKASNSIII